MSSERFPLPTALSTTDSFCRSCGNTARKSMIAFRFKALDIFAAKCSSQPFFRNIDCIPTFTCSLTRELVKYTKITISCLWSNGFFLIPTLKSLHVRRQPQNLHT